jgi:hypothetical protein
MMTIRDLLTMAALVLVLLLASRAHSEAPPEDILGVLSGPLAQKVLDHTVDDATAKLRSTHERGELQTTRGHEQQESLGIGKLGTEDGLPARVDFLPDPARVRAESIVARATAQVGACYGEPMRGDSRYDSLVVRVLVDSRGAVAAVRILRPTRFGQRGTETCVSRVLEQLRFPHGLTNSVAQVGYRWSFDLGGSTRIRFAADEAAPAGKI